MPTPKVFISYSHKDEVWKDHLVSHLGVLEQQGLLQTWDDRRIGAGQDWIEEIRTGMNEARVAVFLVSRHSLTSKFILHKEIPHLLERKAEEGIRIFPVIVGSCAWETVSWLAQLEVRPSDGKALADFRGNNRDREWTKIVKDILDIVARPEPPPFVLIGEKPKTGRLTGPPSTQPQVSGYGLREFNLQTAVNEIVASTLRKREKGENFPFFFIVGAGISHPPIPLAAGIEKLCREKLTADGIDIPLLDKKSALDSYQILFEYAFPQAEDRQDFLHDLIHRKPISAANLRLAHLLGELKLTNLVFTTNFDEMLSRALHLLGYDVIVCDHPKTTARIKPAQKISQVVHVHGTHWFYDCCNLKSEIDAHARLDFGDSLSMGQLLDRVLADRSPIIIGYSGWEEDVVMSAIKRRLGQPSLRNLYWFCYRRLDAETLPSWLKTHNHVRLILPPLPRTGDLRADESFEREPMLPAREILEALIQKLRLAAPLLAQDPLKFFSNHLAANLLLEEEEGEDLYLLQQVIDRVRKSARREEEERQAGFQPESATSASLTLLSDAVRRLAYEEALEIAQQIDRTGLTQKQQATLEAALEQTVKAIVNKGIALRKEGQSNEAILVYEKVVAHFGDSPKPTLRELVAQALVNKGVSLGDLGRSDEEVSVYEEVIARFRDSQEPALCEQAAKALFNKGVALGELGRFDEAFSAYEEMVERFKDSPEPALREMVAMALVNKGVYLGQLRRFDEAVSVYEEVKTYFGDSPDPAIREQVARALFNKGVSLGQLKRFAEAVSEYEQVVRLLGNFPNPALREMVAKALVNKGVSLGQLGNFAEALSVYREVVARFGDSSEPALRVPVARALYSLSSALGSEGRWQEALETARKAASLGGERYNLACALLRTGNIDEALMELEGCLSREEISREHVLKDPDWEALRDDPRFKELTKEPEGS